MAETLWTVWGLNESSPVMGMAFLTWLHRDPLQLWQLTVPITSTSFRNLSRLDEIFSCKSLSSMRLVILDSRAEILLRSECFVSKVRFFFLSSFYHPSILTLESLIYLFVSVSFLPLILGSCS